mgnify:CR=1 FL=1
MRPLVGLQRPVLAMVGLVTAALAAGASLGWSAAWSRRAPAPAAVAPTPVATPPPPGVAIRGAALILRHRGRRQAEVRADRVEVSADTRFARFRGIRQATLYRGGAPALHLRAREIVLDRATDDFTVLGDLEITTPQGDRMRAPEARWSAARRTLTFPRGVDVAIGGHRVRAARLVVDLALETLHLEGGVDVTFALDGSLPGGIPR